MTKLRITLTKSTIGYNAKQGRIVKSLGLRKISHSVNKDDSPTIRGMIEKVKHLVEVQKIEATDQ
jgi:large subunit ribosomal protein L30